jgi:hypothetical protein
LDADTRLLLGELRLAAQPEDGALERVRQRLAVSLTATLGGVAGKSAPSAPPAVANATRSGWLVAGKGGALAVFALGGLAGAAGYAWLRPPVVRTVYRDRVVEPVAARALASSASPAPVIPSAVPAMPAAHARRESPPAEAAPQPTTATMSGDEPTPIVDSEGLAGELKLIDKARASLGAGDA